MKKCPFCAEEIQEDAIKCKHCNEFLDGRMQEVGLHPPNKLPWYFRTSFIVMLILTIGPFALPLVWVHPQYSLTKKIIISVVVLAVSYFLGMLTAKAMQSITNYYKTILGPM